ncbi:MAG: FAD-binding oxidoreductase, partial [Candidatus Dadabacteria bacterium]
MPQIRGRLIVLKSGQKNGTLNPIGWGYEEQAVDPAELRPLLRGIGSVLGIREDAYQPPIDPGAIELPPPRWTPPTALRDRFDTSPATRLLHAAGRSYRDLVALRTGQIRHAPDAVAQPANRDELGDLYELADRDRLALIPRGGGSSVCGGVNPEVPDDFNGTIIVDLTRMNRVLDIDVTDRVVHAEAGILGPDLDAALAPHGLATRHYPQSYYHSTLGGWVAARGAGHFSTQYAKIEDRVVQTEMVTPAGLAWRTRQLPASSVVVDPNRLAAGSEGMFGILTEIALRVVSTPTAKAADTWAFQTFEQALEAGRAIVQAGLWPTQMRILDPFERLVSAMLSGNPAPPEALVLLSFEGEAQGVVDARAAAAENLLTAMGGKQKAKTAAGGEGAAEWKQTFFRQPYLRDVLIDHAVIADTFETAIPWHRAADFYQEVRSAVLDALNEVCGGGAVLCRSTHAYPDGVALYFSFYGAGRHGDLIDQWWTLKRAAQE